MFKKRQTSVILLSCLFLGLTSCTKPISHVNRGSCLVALSDAVEQLRAFAAANAGKLPYNEGNQEKALMDIGVPEHHARLLRFVNMPRLDSSEDRNMIVLICINEPAPEKVYVAKAGGDILLVPKRVAKLGSRLPEGAGEIFIPAPK